MGERAARMVQSFRQSRSEKAVMAAVISWIVLLFIYAWLPVGTCETSRAKNLLMGGGKNPCHGWREAFTLRRDTTGKVALQLDRSDSYTPPSIDEVDRGRVEVFVRRVGWWAMTRQETLVLWSWVYSPRTISTDQLRQAIGSEPGLASRWDEDAIHSAVSGATVTRRLWTGYALNGVTGIVLVIAIISTPYAIASGWRSKRSRRWRATGRCGACGYDLSGSPGNSCSECGAPRCAEVVTFPPTPHSS